MAIMIVVNYFEVHKSDVCWEPFDVRKKRVTYMDLKILHLFFISTGIVGSFLQIASFFVQ